MDQLSDCGVTPSWREKLPLSDPKGGGGGRCATSDPVWCEKTAEASESPRQRG